MRPLREEMAFIAYHFHWGPAELLSLEHGERRRWCREISRINAQLDRGSGTALDEDILR